MATCPKIEIINHFDELINQVDIDIEEALTNYSENQVLGDLKCFKIEERKRNLFFRNIAYLVKFRSSLNEDGDYQTVELWSESTKVVDYLNQVRMRTIDELRKAQEERLEYYKLNSERFKTEELKSQLFGERFYFQVRIKRENKPWFFNLFTFVTDFYMSPSEIHIFEMFICNDFKELEKYFGDSKCVLDEKMVLIYLLEDYFCDNLLKVKYPNHVIFVTKRDILNINVIHIEKSIHKSQMRVLKLNCSSIDLSKLSSLILFDEYDEIELVGLLSLKNLSLRIKKNEFSEEQFSLRNLPALNYVWLFAENLNKSISKQLFENLQNIRELKIESVFSDINLDDLVNLEKLSISGEIDDEFNFGLFKNISNHLQELSFSLSNISNEQIAKLFYGLNFPYLVKLEIKHCKKVEDGYNFELFKSLCINLQELSIDINNIDNESISKLFYGHKFPNLVELQIKYGKITKLEKKMFEGFPKLHSLNITYNKELRKIDNDAFSNLTNLAYLDLRGNCIDSINQLSQLINLETLVLSNNAIECIEENAFSNLKNLKNLELNSNNLSKLNPKSFIGLENLNFLNLSNNKLTYFDLSIFNYICNINRIALFSNYIVNRDETFTCIKALKEGKIRVY